MALQLHRLSHRGRLYRDNTLTSLREAIAALIASFPVYRTYFDDEDTDASESAWIRGAATKAVLRDPDVTPEAMEFLTSVLLLSHPPEHEEDRSRWVHFRRQFQQVSAPVMAKGVEDTTLFRYSRLLALNEVGCAADSEGIGAARAHAWFSARAAEWPGTMSASSTHDTKRSEDVRSRLAVLSEYPREWSMAARTWSRLNASKRRQANGREVPDTDTEYYLYQTLLGAWEGNADAAFIERMQEHMTKAVREAKRFTSWMRVDEPYEAALAEFVRDILASRRRGAFLAQLDRFVTRLRPAAALNSLVAVALKCMAPGFPDFYQGSERPIFQLTDPDNRRPLDPARLTLPDLPPGEVPTPIEPVAKAWLTRRLLKLRGCAPQLFGEGGYRSVEATGEHAAQLFCFSRETADAQVVVLLPRSVAPLLDASANLQPGAFANTSVVLQGRCHAWTNWLTGERHTGASEFNASAILARFPVAVLVQDPAE